MDQELYRHALGGQPADATAAYAAASGGRTPWTIDA